MLCWIGFNRSMKMRETSRARDNNLSVNNNQDTSVYDAMVVMAQPFSLRYPLVDGAGNWGSSQGDPAAAYRYTEARLSPVAELMLEDIEKDTLDMQDNYDNTIKEPIALGGYFPCPLTNATNGIGVGIASSFAPHYLGDVVKAADLILERMITKQGYTDDELISIVKAPDFPTGGTIINADEIPTIYKTGRGRVVIQSIS